MTLQSIHTFSIIYSETSDIYGKMINDLLQISGQNISKQRKAEFNEIDLTSSAAGGRIGQEEVQQETTLRLVL